MFFEGLGSATIVNGVMRIETLHRNAKGEDVVGGELFIPINRIASVAAGLQLLVQKTEEAANAAPPVPTEVN